MSISLHAARLAVAGACLASLAPFAHAQVGGEPPPGTQPSACAGPAAAPRTAALAPTDSGASAARRPTTPSRDTGHVALRILASATAADVRFVGSPRVCVLLTGDVKLDSVHVLGRRNIASPVVSGTSYRDVYVAVEILGRLNAECISARITGQAGGDAGRASCASLGATGGAGASPP